jgi:predicted amidohydrolase
MVIRLAQVRTYPVLGDLAANYCLLLGILDQLVRHAPDVVVTPEGFLDGYIAKAETVSRETICQYAIDPTDSPYVERIAAWAGDHHAWFVLGCTRCVPTGAYNTALIFNRAGELVSWYDKTHLLAHDTKYLPGQVLPVFESDFGPFGVMICADRRWSETVRTLALQGARVIFNPTYGFHDEKNMRMMQTRSYESEVFIAFTHPARSLVTGPEGGVVLDDASPDVRLSVMDIDLSEVDDIRRSAQSHLKNRRIDLYRC